MRLLALLLIAVSLPLQAGELSRAWPQWRGPQRDGSMVGAEAWPANLPTQQVWRKELGPSYSGPIVVGNTLFLTETTDKKYETVMAFDIDSGKQLWKAQWEGAMSVPFFARSNGDWIRATPAHDGTRLFVAGMRDVLVCLDAKSGKIQWKFDFVKEFKTPVPSFGFVSSPLVDGNFVYVQAGGGLVKLDKTNGKVVWRSLNDGGGMYGSAFSSPVIATLNGKRQMVVQTRSRLAGVDIETGKELWSKDIPAFRGMNILTPTVIGDQIFTSSYGGKTMALKLEGSELVQSWKNKTQGYMSSPVVVGGHMYLHLRNQRFICVDLESGEVRWTTKPFGKYWSMVVNGDKILALDERGELMMIQASPEEFKLIDRKKISESSAWAHLAVVGNRVFVRDLDGISVLKW